MGSIDETPPSQILSDINDTKVLFTPFNLPGSRIVHGNLFPLALKISKADNSDLTLDEAAAAIRDLSERGLTTDLLNKHGALIFRGNPDPSPKAFSTLVHAAEEGRGRHPFDQLGLAGSRTYLDKEVFTASESPPHLWIGQHNEYSRYTKFPTNIHFFCSKSPEEGGESPLNHSAELFDRLIEELPEFVEECRVKGLKSPDIYRPPGKEGKNFIFTWAGPLAFGRDIKPGDDLETMKFKAEKQVVRLTPHYKWLEGDELEVNQYVPAFWRHPVTGRPVWFSSMPGRYGVAFDRKATEPPYIGDDGQSYPPHFYGDGIPIPTKYLHRMWELSNEGRVFVKAQPGDMILVDNYQVMHGRAPWTKGDRTILVSMWDSDKPGDLLEAY